MDILYIMGKKVAECGTMSGYKRHRRNGEVACDPCRTANTEFYMNKYRNNPEYKARVLKTQYARHKERMETDPEYAKKQKERFHKIYEKRYQDPEFRQRLLDASNNWSKENREERRAHNRRHGAKRRALKLNNGIEPYTEQEVLDRYGTDCHICTEPINLEAPRQAGKDGWEKGLHIDHFIPIIKGGPDTLENVRPAHAVCNLSKGHKEPEV